MLHFVVVKLAYLSYSMSVAAERLQSSDDLDAERLTASDDGNYAINDTLAIAEPKGVQQAMSKAMSTIKMAKWAHATKGQIGLVVNAATDIGGLVSHVVRHHVMGQEVTETNIWSTAQRSNQHDFPPAEDVQKAINNPDELAKMGQAMIMAHAVRHRLNLKCLKTAWELLIQGVKKNIIGEHIEMQGLKQSVETVLKDLKDYVHGHDKDTIVNVARSILLAMHIELDNLLDILIKEHSAAQTPTSDSEQESANEGPMTVGMLGTDDPPGTDDCGELQTTNPEPDTDVAAENAKVLCCRNQAKEKRFPWLGWPKSWRGYHYYIEEDQTTADLLREMLWPERMVPETQVTVAKSAQKIVAFAAVLRSMAVMAKDAPLMKKEVKDSLVDIWDNIYGCGGYTDYCTVRTETYTAKIRIEPEDSKHKVTEFAVVLGSRFITKLMVHWAAHSEEQKQQILEKLDPPHTEEASSAEDTEKTPPHTEEASSAEDTEKTIHIYYGGVGVDALAKVKGSIDNDNRVDTFQYYNPGWTWGDLLDYLCHWRRYNPMQMDCRDVMGRISEVAAAATLGHVLAFAASAGVAMAGGAAVAGAVGSVAVYIAQAYEPLLLAAANDGIFGTLSHGTITVAGHIISSAAVAVAAHIILPALGIYSISRKIYDVYATWDQDSDDGTDPVTIAECMCDAMKAIENPVPVGKDQQKESYGIGALMCNEELPLPEPKLAPKTKQVSCFSSFMNSMASYLKQAEDTPPKPTGTKGVVELKEAHDTAWDIFLSCADLQEEAPADDPQQAVSKKCNFELKTFCATADDLENLCPEVMSDAPTKYQEFTFKVGSETNSSDGQILFRTLCDLAYARVLKRLKYLADHNVFCITPEELERICFPMG